MKPISKVIPPRSRVRLIRADERTPNWRKDVGRQFRVGYYSRKDGLGCIWLVNEKGEYEQTTDAKFLAKYFDVERLSTETNLYGLGKRRFAKMRVKSALERLNGRSAIDVFEAAKELWEKGDTTTVRGLIDTLRCGKKVLNRTAAAYALNLANAKTAIRSLEISVANRREHPKVRGQAAESLAHHHRARSHRVLRANLLDPSREVRFWCAFALWQMGDRDALVSLEQLAKGDHRVVKGLWSVSKEAKDAIRSIRKTIRNQKGRVQRCQFCTKVWKNKPRLQRTGKTE
jgi:HEAT repeat protein